MVRIKFYLIKMSEILIFCSEYMLFLNNGKINLKFYCFGDLYFKSMILKSVKGEIVVTLKLSV